jgi:hypothetical protein
MAVLSVDSFPSLAGWGSPTEIEVRRRIQVAVGAYAYEVVNRPIISDHEWDRMAQSINTRMGTNHPIIDEFFATQFSPMTGMWIHDHPELEGISRIYHRYVAIAGR